MGLDMYLTKKHYNGAKEEVAYWRKVNMIHYWFVKNVQEGNDNCDEYYVTIEQLQTLLDLCKKVKEDVELGKELLPTAEGFFFGSTEYDEYYMENIDYTIGALTTIIKKHSEEDLDSDYYYRSSW